ncbi:MAG: anti-anti-sigma factor [Methylothermaceae bacteria B42]|nr:MAG: anti-anti-sigma factor [Methylothermaceae bacteria B42]HHJ40206.1 anti-sigma factor antagonist [Methylothermaceae bacterium]
MKLQIDKQKDWRILRLLEPRLDAHNSGELKDRILKLLENGEKDLIIDLSEVRFIDSSGLGALLSGYKNANLHQGRLVLAGPQPRVRSMFELTRLNQVFDIYASVDEALAEN